MKKILTMLSLFLLIFTTIAFASPSLDLSANSVILIDTTTGQTVYEKESNTKQYPASLTKILTAIITLEECQLTDSVKVSENAVMSIPAGSSIGYFQAGETVTVEQLLHALLLPSGNDAANILAEHIAGSNASFAAMMNTKAKELGANDSNFVNPHGLHDENHYTTAHDLAVIAKYAMQNETFRKIVSTKTYTMPNTSTYEGNERKYKNTNLLLFEEAVYPNTKSYYYEYVTGIKTGYTKQAGNTLVASAKKDNMELICVLLNIETSDENSNRYLDAKKLFTYGFNNYSLLELNVELPDVDIDNAKSNTKLQLQIENTGYVLGTSSTDTTNLQPKLNLKEGLVAPIKKGDNVGSVEFEIDGKLYEYNLTAKEDVLVKASFGEIILNIFKFIGKLILYVFISLVIFAILVRVVRKSMKKKKKRSKARRYKN